MGVEGAENQSSLSAELFQDAYGFLIRLTVVILVDHILENRAVEIGQTEERHAAAELQIVRISEDRTGWAR